MDKRSIEEPTARSDVAANRDTVKRRSDRALRRQAEERGSSARMAVVPVVAVAAAAAVGWFLAETVGFTPLIVFHMATAASTWLAGPVAGVLSTLLSFVVGERFFFANSLFDGFTSAAVAQAIDFLIAAGSIVAGLSVLRAALHRAARGARRGERLTNRLRRRNAESRRSAAQYRALNEVAAALPPALTAGAVRELVLGRGATAAGASLALIVSLESDEVQVSSGGEWPDGLTDDIASASVVRDRLVSGATGWVAGADLGDGVAERSGCELWAVLPLLTRDRRFGVLVLGYGRAAVPTVGYQAIAELLAQQCAQALERARLYQAERSLRVQAQFAERQMSFLALASSALAATLDTTRSLAEVADISATSLGGFCAIHVVEQDGQGRLVAGSFTSEAGLIRFGGDEDRYSLHSGSMFGYPAVLASGQPQLLAELTPAMLEDAAASPERAAALRELGLQSQICLPLVVRDTVVGAITVASTEPGRRLGSAEMTLVEHLCRRVAQAVDAAQLYRAAVQASRAKSSFLAVMSHELRTPLNAILGYADLILVGIPARVPDETRHQVERIRYSAAHLLELVDDLLSFARVEAGRDRVQVETVQLEAVVREAVAMIQPLAAGKGLKLGLSLPDSVTMSTDRAKLIRILHNLLSNAAKFTAQGSVKVDVRTDGDHVIAKVIDTGIGIAPANQERIFDPFWQVEQSPTRQHGGTGIGLGVARQLARMLGGDLTVESEVGKGSTFTLRLPVRIEARAPATE
jgi:signal transduction histidine kinase